MDFYDTILMNADGGADGGAAPADAGAAPKPTEQAHSSDAKFTQEDLNNIIAKESAKLMEKSRNQTLKELGFDDPASAKERIEKLKALEDSQKTETERLQGQYKDLDGKFKETSDTLSALQLENAALKAGVPGEKAEKVMKLAGAYEGETAGDRIKAVLVDFPEFMGSQKVAPASFSGPSNNQKVDQQQSLASLARKTAGLM